MLETYIDGLFPIRGSLTGKIVVSIIKGYAEFLSKVPEISTRRALGPVSGFRRIRPDKQINKIVPFLLLLLVFFLEVDACQGRLRRFFA